MQRFAGKFPMVWMVLLTVLVFLAVSAPGAAMAMELRDLPTSSETNVNYQIIGAGEHTLTLLDQKYEFTLKDMDGGIVFEKKGSNAIQASYKLGVNSPVKLKYGGKYKLWTKGVNTKNSEFRYFQVLFQPYDLQVVLNNGTESLGSFNNPKKIEKNQIAGLRWSSNSDASSYVFAMRDVTESPEYGRVIFNKPTREKYASFSEVMHELMHTHKYKVAVAAVGPRESYGYSWKGDDGDSLYFQINDPPVVITSLSVSPKEVTVLPGNTQSVTVTAWYSDGRSENVTDRVDWSPSSNNAVQISRGNVTAIAPGELRTTASFQGKSDTLYVRVPAPSLMIEPSGLVNMRPGDVQNVRIYADYGSGREDVTSKAEWRSSNSVVAEVFAGRITAKSGGQARIDAYYQGVWSPSLTANVVELTGIKLNPAMTTKLKVGETRAFTATAIYSNNTESDVTVNAVWRSEPSGVIGADKGQVKGLIPGQTKLIAIYTESGKTVEASVPVEVIKPEVRQIAVMPKEVTLPPGSSKQIKVEATYADGQKDDITALVTWTPSGVVNAAEIANGKLDAKSPGDVLFTATYEGQKDAVNVHVLTPQLSIDPVEPINMRTSATLDIHLYADYTGFPREDVTGKAEWRSENSNVVAVNAGRLTSKTSSADPVLVTAVYMGQKASMTVRVFDSKLFFDPPGPLKLKVGNAPVDLHLKLSDLGNIAEVTKQVTNWKISDSTVVAFQSGQITAQKTGSAKIVADYQGLQSPPFVVNVIELMNLKLSPSLTPSMNTGETQSFSVIAQYSDGSELDVTDRAVWQVNPPDLLTIEKGKAAARKPGKAAWTVSYTDGKTAKLEGVMEIIRTREPKALIAKTTQPLDAQGYLNLELGKTDSILLQMEYDEGSKENVPAAEAKWVVDNNQVLKIDNQTGQITAQVIGEARVTISCLNKSAEVKVRVTPTLEGIEIIPSKALDNAGVLQMTVGEVLGVKIVAVYSDKSKVDVPLAKVVWNNPNEQIVRMNATGNKVTAASPGNVIVSAAYLGRKAELQIAVSENVLHLQSSPPKIEGKTGEKKRITIILVDSNGFPIKDVTREEATKYYSEDESIVVINNGTVILKNPNKEDVYTSIKITYPGVPQVLIVPVKVSGTGIIKPIEYLEASPPAAKLKPGEKLEIDAIAHFTDGSTLDVTRFARWSSDDTDIAIVDHGQVEVVTDQTGIDVKISVEYGEKTATTVISVVDGGIPPVELYTNTKNVKLFLDERYNRNTAELRLFAKYSSGEDRDVTQEARWSSEDESIAYVDEDGVITATGVGRTKIHANYVPDGFDVGVEIDPILVNVEQGPKIKKLEFNKSKVQVKVGTQDILTLIATYADGSREDVSKLATITVLRPDLATVEVSEEGKVIVTGIRPGITKLNAKYGDKTLSTTVKVTK